MIITGHIIFVIYYTLFYLKEYEGHGQEHWAACMIGRVVKKLQNHIKSAPDAEWEKK